MCFKILWQCLLYIQSEENQHALKCYVHYVHYFSQTPNWTWLVKWGGSYSRMLWSHLTFYTQSSLHGAAFPRPHLTVGQAAPITTETLSDKTTTSISRKKYIYSNVTWAPQRWGEQLSVCAHVNHAGNFTDCCHWRFTWNEGLLTPAWLFEESTPLPKHLLLLLLLLLWEWKLFLGHSPCH